MFEPILLGRKFWGVHLHRNDLLFVGTSTCTVFVHVLKLRNFMEIKTSMAKYLAISDIINSLLAI